MQYYKIIFSILFISFPLFAFGRSESVVLQSTALKIFPENKSDSVATLNKGAHVFVLQKSNNWCLVESAVSRNALKGWIACSDLSSFEVDSPAVSKEVVSTPTSDRFRLSLAINPITIFFPWIEFQIGLGFTPHFRLNITPQLMTWWASGSSSGVVFGGTVSATYFFDDWQGWYLEPGAVYFRGSRGSGYASGGQLIGGYEHLWSSGVFCNLGLGINVGYFDDGSKDDDWLRLKGVYTVPTANAFLGYKF
ncbi:MAG: hypothetical protein JWQ35_2430 [Bacteriovoracaceae bacterium]|nr:hypothetical protein [Bacteriovoracaceae bacterium]